MTEGDTPNGLREQLTGRFVVSCPYIAASVTVVELQRAGRRPR